jgi:hypothetical protein
MRTGKDVEEKGLRIGLAKAFTHLLDLTMSKKVKFRVLYLVDSCRIDDE